MQQSIEILQFPIRIYNALTRSGIKSISKLEERMNEHRWYDHCRLLSKTSAREIADKMLQLSIIDENHPGCNLD